MLEIQIQEESTSVVYAIYTLFLWLDWFYCLFFFFSEIYSQRGLGWWIDTASISIGLLQCRDWGRVILCCEVLLCVLRHVSIIPGLCLLDASSSHAPVQL